MLVAPPSLKRSHNRHFDAVQTKITLTAKRTAQMRANCLYGSGFSINVSRTDNDRSEKEKGCTGKKRAFLIEVREITLYLCTSGRGEKWPKVPQCISMNQLY